ncbi:hypothetical protein CRG98_021297, partial [Punica granatum]
MITGCPGIVGVPLLSHLGSTLIFPGRVIRQLGGLQDVPAEADRLPFHIQWADSTSTALDRFLQIREIRRQRDACIIQRLYFPEHPTDDERVFAATSAYVGSSDRADSSTRPGRTPRSGDGPLERGVGSSAQEGAQPRPPLGLADVPIFALARTYAAFKRPSGVKGCRLYVYVPFFSSMLTFALTHSWNLGDRNWRHTATRLVSVLGWRKGITSMFPKKSTLRSQPSLNHRRHTPRHLSLLQLLALLRGPNRASSSSTPPPGPGLTIDPTPWAPPTQAPENVEAPALPTLYTSAVHPFTSQLPPPPAPSPHADLSYQAPPPINTTFHEPGTPTHAAQFAFPTHFFSEADVEHERRLKRMEETIRALQAGDARLDAHHGDCSLFPDMRPPPKLKIPEFKTYEGATDPRHHLRHYRGKMLQYWEYEEFFIHSFQDSLSGSALDWFMSLKAEDIPTWEDLSRKFIDQYRYYAETPPTLLELSTKEMARGQMFEDKGEESSKKIPATSSSSSGRRGKEISVNTVNTAQQAPQQYSMNYTAAPPVAPSYAPQAPQYRPQAPTQSIYYSALPPPPLPAVSSPVVHHYAPAPSQVPQYQPPVPRTTQPAQRAPPPQGQQTGAAQPRPRKQYPALPVPLSHIYRQIRDKANPLPDHGPAQGASINMITVCTSSAGGGEQGGPSPVVIEYVPAEVAVGFAGVEAPHVPLVIDVPAREPYSNDRVPWTYEGTYYLEGLGSTRPAPFRPPYIISVGDDENLPFHSFETVSVIPDYGKVGPSRADRMIGKVLLRHNYIPGTGLGARGQGINRPIEVEEYKHRRGLGFRPSCHEIIEARRGNHLHRLAPHYGVHIRSAQEDEELNNWTSVLRYSAVIADVLHSNLNFRRVDSNPSEECLGELGPIYFGEGLDEDSLEPEIEESLRRLEDRQLTSLEPTEEINVGTQEEPRILKIGTSLDPTKRVRMIDFLTRYQEVFAWSYADMPGLDPSIVKHFLPLDTEKFPPKQQQLQRQRASLLLRIKEEVVKQINAGFLEVCNYFEWVANIVPMEKKDGRVRVCVDYRDLNKASPKDNFPLPHIDILVDNTARHAQLRQYTLYHTICLLSKADPFKYLLDSPSSTRNLAKWRCQLTEYDIEYVSRTSVKGQAIADHLAEFPIEDHTPINPNFPDEGILQVDGEGEKPGWKMYFDGAVNSTGSDIKNLLQTGQYPPFADRRDRKTLRRLAIHYFLSGEILYRRSFDSTLLRCIDEHESRRLMEEMHRGNCGPHMNGLMLAKKIMRLGYYWSTMETD